MELHGFFHLFFSESNNGLTNFSVNVWLSRHQAYSCLLYTSVVVSYKDDVIHYTDGSKKAIGVGSEILFSERLLLMGIAEDSEYIDELYAVRMAGSSELCHQDLKCIAICTDSLSFITALGNTGIDDPLLLQIQGLCDVLLHQEL